MVERLQGGFPANELEVLPIVVGVAVCAVLLLRLGIYNGRVIAAMRSEAAGDFAMAIQASELLSASTQPMAGCAFSGPAPRLVGTRERPGRNLAKRLWRY